MIFWNRMATLQIGPKKHKLDELSFAFKVKFEDSSQLCTAEVKVYNLSKNTHNNINEGDAVIINAGYEDDMGVLFVGKVNTCSSERKNQEWITSILATVAIDEWLSKTVNKTYKKNISAKDMLDDLLNLFGLEIGAQELAENKIYPGGKICKGKLKDVLYEIVEKDCKSRLLIRSGQLFIMDPAKSINYGYLLTPATGLLYEDKKQNSRQITTHTNQNSSKEAMREDGNTISKKSLLNYHLGPADEVMIIDSETKGRYKIIRGEHSGSQSGEYVTRFEAKLA